MSETEWTAEQFLTSQALIYDALCRKFAEKKLIHDVDDLRGSG